MDRNKLNKAAGEDWCNNVLERDLKPITKSAFKRGADWLMQQPLSERLTKEEKEKFRKVYKSLERNDINPDLPLELKDCALSQINLFEFIFGTELFEKNE